MIFFEFELQMQRKLRKGMLNIRMRVLGLPCSTHAWNLSELGPHWHGLLVGNIVGGSFKIPKNSKPLGNCRGFAWRRG